MLADAPRPIAASAIPFLHWSMRVGRDGPAWGEIASQLDDLNQGIVNLMLTPVGSVPTQPEKGCDVLSALDLPPEVAIPRLTVTIWNGLARWHPRIVVDSVRVEQLAFERFSCPLFWRPAAFALADILRTDLLIGRDGVSATLARVPAEAVA